MSRKANVLLLVVVTGVLTPNLVAQTWEKSTPAPAVLAHVLGQAGFEVKDVKDVLPAITDERPWIRLAAIQYLGPKFGQAGVEGLKLGLEDEWLTARIAAARALTELGDPAGLERMIRDWDALVQDDDAGEPAQQIKSVSEALNVGLVLAESGDARALHLAQNAAINGKLVSIRVHAMMVLVQGVKLAEQSRLESSVRPSEVLKQIALTERNHAVQRVLSAIVVTSRMDKATGVPILEALKSSPHASPAIREMAERSIKATLRNPATRPAATLPSD